MCRHRKIISSLTCSAGTPYYSSASTPLSPAVPSSLFFDAFTDPKISLNKIHPGDKEQVKEGGVIFSFLFYFLLITTNPVFHFPLKQG